MNGPQLNLFRIPCRLGAGKYVYIHIVTHTYGLFPIYTQSHIHMAHFQFRATRLSGVHRYSHLLLVFRGLLLFCSPKIKHNHSTSRIRNFSTIYELDMVELFETYLLSAAKNLVHTNDRFGQPNHLHHQFVLQSPN